MGHLNFGPPSIGRERLWCSTCNDYTLRILFGICNHCKKGPKLGSKERAILAGSSRRGMESARKQMQSRRKSIWEPIKKRVLAWLEANPADTFTHIGKKLGCSRSFVSKCAAEKGKLRG